MHQQGDDLHEQDSEYHQDRAEAVQFSNSNDAKEPVANEVFKGKFELSNPGAGDL